MQAGPMSLLHPCAPFQPPSTIMPELPTWPLSASRLTRANLPRDLSPTAPPRSRPRPHSKSARRRPRLASSGRPARPARRALPALTAPAGASPSGRYTAQATAVAHSCGFSPAAPRVPRRLRDIPASLLHVVSSFTLRRGRYTFS